MVNKLNRLEESTRELYVLLRHRILTRFYCVLVLSLRTAEQLMDKCETNSEYGNVTQNLANSLYSQLFFALFLRIHIHVTLQPPCQYTK